MAFQTRPLSGATESLGASLTETWLRQIGRSWITGDAPRTYAGFDQDQYNLSVEALPKPANKDGSVKRNREDRSTLRRREAAGNV
ncbi:MAG: hypothetical protein IT384_04140 [Deltaproteobacteria bacterium]|nr:hypothetical protein [Deltaproteobacteria bacterium]